MQVEKNGFTISTNKALLDTRFIHHFLTHSYWAAGIPESTVKKSIDNSLCFGVYKDDRQVGFARLVTDEATFAYLADVFIDEEFRGQGLAKWLMEAVMQYPGIDTLRRVLLATRDAHMLYRQFGFTPLPMPDRFMQLHQPDVYKKKVY